MTPLIDMRFPQVAVAPREHGAAVGTYIKFKYSSPQVEQPTPFMNIFGQVNPPRQQITFNQAYTWLGYVKECCDHLEVSDAIQNKLFGWLAG